MKMFGLLIAIFGFAWASFSPFPFSWNSMNASEISINNGTLYWNGEEIGNGVVQVYQDNGIITGLRQVKDYGFEDAYFKSDYKTEYGVMSRWIEYKSTYLTYPKDMNFDDMRFALTVEGTVNGGTGLNICSAIPSDSDYGSLKTFWKIIRNAPSSQYNDAISGSLAYFAKQYKNASWVKTGESTWEIYKVGSR